jgi:hypothetical protein
VPETFEGDLHQEETFSVTLPPGWAVRRDEERVYLVSAQPPGVLCCTSQRVEVADDLPNLSRMLAGFLTRTGHPVATDELMRISNVPGAAGFCWQYFEDGNFHRIWIFGNHACWLLWTFTSATSDLDHFHPLLERLLKTLALVEA